MNKKILINKIIQHLRKKRMEIEVNLKGAFRAAAEAPGPMESHSDTIKSQMHTLVENLNDQLDENKQAIKTLEDFSESQQSDEIRVGSLVEVREGGKQVFYFILPVSGGAEVKDEDKKQTVMVITPHAPLSTALMNKKIGEKVRFQTHFINKELEVINIW